MLNGNVRATKWPCRTIVLVSLNAARKKGTDTRVIADVQQTRDALETDYSGSNYSVDLNNAGTGCSPATGVANLNAIFANCANVAANATGPLQVQSNDANNEGVANDILYYIGTNNASYALRGKLTASTGYFCIDSTGSTNVNDNSLANVQSGGIQRCN